MKNSSFNNVLFIGPQNKFGGIGSVLNVYFKHLEKYKFLPSHFDTNRFNNLFIFCAAYFKLLFLLITCSDIKILHIHSASKGSFIRKIIFGLTGKMWRKKIVFHIHSGSFPLFYNKSKFRKWLVVSLLRRMDSIICLSQLWKNVFYSDLSLDNLDVIGNPIDQNENIHLKSFDHTIDLFYLGNICEEKGIFDFIKYLSTNNYFLEKKINLFIGGIGNVKKLRDLLSILPNVNQIKYLGWLNKDQKELYFKEHCDVFVLPSYKEGLPMSILEAMSYGKPIISTTVGGIPSIVLDRYNGWLFHPGCFTQLDTIFDEIFYSSDHFDYYQNNSLEFVKEFRTENILDKLNDCYQRLLSI